MKAHNRLRKKIESTPGIGNQTKLRALRLERGHAVSRQAVSSWCCGHTKPKPPQLRCIMDIFQLSAVEQEQWRRSFWPDPVVSP